MSSIILKCKQIVQMYIIIFEFLHYAVILSTSSGRLVYFFFSMETLQMTIEQRYGKR